MGRQASEEGNPPDDEMSSVDLDEAASFLEFSEYVLIFSEAAAADLEITVPLPSFSCSACYFDERGQQPIMLHLDLRAVVVQNLAIHKCIGAIYRRAWGCRGDHRHRFDEQLLARRG